MTTIIASKLAQKYSGPDVEAMKSIAKAHENRSLEEFEKLSITYKAR